MTADTRERTHHTGTRRLGDGIEHDLGGVDGGHAGPSFSCAVIQRRQAVHVCPAGELDLSTVPEVDARLAELHLAGLDEIVLDLSGVTFFDSCGVQLVTRWARRSADECFHFAVIAGNDVVERVLKLTGVKPHLPSCGGTLPDPTQ